MKYINKVITIVIFAIALAFITNNIDFDLDKSVREYIVENSNKKAAYACEIQYPVTKYTSAATVVHDENGATIGLTLAACTEVKVYCESNGFYKISDISEKWVEKSKLSDSTSCSSLTTTTTPKVTFSGMSEITGIDAKMYQGKEFSLNTAVTGVQNLPKSEENNTSKINIFVSTSSSCSNTNSNFTINRDYDYDNKILNVNISNSGNVSAGNYYVCAKSESGNTANKVFTINKKEFYFNMNLSDYTAIHETDYREWYLYVSDQIPSSINLDNFNLTIYKSNGQEIYNETSNVNDTYFTVEKNAGVIKLSNFRRDFWEEMFAFWTHTPYKFTPADTYKIRLTLKNTSEYEGDKIPNFYKELSITIGDAESTLSEDPNNRKVTRFQTDEIGLSYDIDVIGTKTVSDETYFIVNENEFEYVDGKKVITDTNTVEYTEEQFKKIYINIPLDEIKLNIETRNSNKIAIKVDGVSIIKYLDGKITYYDAEGTKITDDEEDFAELYEAAYETLKPTNTTETAKYKVTDSGEIYFHDEGVGTKIVEVINEKKDLAPLSATGGKMDFTVNYENFNASSLQNAKISLKMTKDGITTDLITDAGFNNAGQINDSNFSIEYNPNMEDGVPIDMSDPKVYITVTYTGHDDKYICDKYTLILTMNTYDINGNPKTPVTLNMSFPIEDSPVDYYIFSEYDSHSDTEDSLLPGANPISNKKYEYKLGMYFLKARTELTSIEKDSVGYRIYNHLVDYVDPTDPDQGIYFYERYDYAVQITRLYNDKVYYKLSYDDGQNWEENGKIYEKTFSDFAESYADAYFYIKDYEAGMTNLKYYNLDENGYIISNNFVTHETKNVDIKRIYNVGDVTHVSYSLAYNTIKTDAENNQVYDKTMEEFQEEFPDDYKYISDYVANKNSLKYFSLDSDGNVLSNNFNDVVHPIKKETLKGNAFETLYYTNNASNTTRTVYMDNTYRRENIEFYSDIVNRLLFVTNKPKHVEFKKAYKDSDGKTHIKYTLIYDKTKTPEENAFEYDKTVEQFQEEFPDDYVILADRLSKMSIGTTEVEVELDEAGYYIEGGLKGRFCVYTEEDGTPMQGKDVTNEFYVQLNGSTDPKNTLSFVPKTEVDPGTYYVYVSHGGTGNKSVGYLFNDESADAAFERAIYPELWMQNTHMTTIEYDDPYYSITYDEPIATNSASKKEVAYKNVESYIDLGFTLNYIYNLDNLQYKIEYESSTGVWTDITNSGYFDIEADINPTKPTTDFETEVLTESHIKLTTKPGVVKEGNYRLVIDYNNNGYTMNTQIREFTVDGNYYGITIPGDNDGQYDFQHNFPETKTIEVNGYEIKNPLDIELTLAYELSGLYELVYYENQKTSDYSGNFVDSTGKVLFSYDVEIETVDAENIKYKLYLKDYVKDGNGNKIINANVGTYLLELSYEEENGEKTEASLEYNVKDDEYLIVAENEKPMIDDEHGMYVQMDLTAFKFAYKNLDNLSYSVTYWDTTTRTEVDVYTGKDKHVTLITDTWESHNSNDEEKNSYEGKLNVYLDGNIIDYNGHYYLKIYYNGSLISEKDFTDFETLFTWNVESVDVYGEIEDDDETIKVNGFYKNLKTTIDVELYTAHLDYIKYIITKDCGGKTCSPETALNYNDRFIIEKQTTKRLTLKYRDDLEPNKELSKGDYQLVVYYTNDDYEVYELNVLNKYVGITIDEVGIITNLGDSKYDYSKLYTNKTSDISVFAKIYGVSYDDVSIDITNMQGSKSYANYFVINRDNFAENHYVDLKYNNNMRIPANNYLFTISYTNEEGRVSDDYTLSFNGNYFDIKLAGVTYDPNPAVTNYEDGGNVIIDVETDELLNQTSTENESIRNTIINNLVITKDNVDVTNLFTKSAILTEYDRNFKINLKYEKDSLEGGIYKAAVSYTVNANTVNSNIEFELIDKEGRIKIKDVEVISETKDNLIHSNYGGTYKVNLETTATINENLLDITVQDATNNDVTESFQYTKNKTDVRVTYVPGLASLSKGEYLITVSYEDPQTGNVTTDCKRVKMYGEYKNITIKNIYASNIPIIAEDENQYYNFQVDNNNLTAEELNDLYMRVYDDYGNMVYSDNPDDGVSNWFSRTKLNDTEYQINIIPYQARVGTYHVALVLKNEDLYNESNRLTFTIDKTRYKATITNSNIVTKEKINNTDNIYDYIGVNGNMSFTTNHPDTNRNYSLKIINNNVTVKEIPLDDVNEFDFSEDEISYGNVEFAICINGLPYDSVNKDVLEYIKVTKVTLVHNYQDVLDEYTIDYGVTNEFDILIEPSNATNKNLKLSSNDESIVSAEGYQITGVSSGTATVTLSNKEYMKTFLVKVSDRIMSNAFDIDYINKTIYVKRMTTKQMDKNVFLNNLTNVISTYQILDKNNNNITNSTNVVGTGYKLVNGAETYTIIVKGDTNGDGKINLSDVNISLRIYRRKLVPDDYVKKAYDINGDGKINLSNVNALLRFYQGNTNAI